MPFEPDKISKQHIIKAAALIDSGQRDVIQSTKFDVIIDGKKYPPKEIMRIAHELATGDYLWEQTGGEPTNKYLRKFGFDVAPKTGVTYYVLGSSWYGNDDAPDQTDRFIQNGIWENGYEDKFLDVVKAIKVNDRVAIKSSFATKDRKSILRIKSLGTVISNDNDGKTINVKWDKQFPAFDLEGLGRYRQTIEKVVPEDIDAIFYHLETIIDSQMTITSKNIILYGPPGTGKTYSTIDMAVKIATGKSNEHDDNKKQFDVLRQANQIEFVTFHQNYSYEDFVVGIKPDIENEQLRFKTHKGIFYEIARRARDNYFASKEKRSKEKDFTTVLEELLAPLHEDKEVEIKMISGKSFWITDINSNSIFFRKAGGGTHHTLSIDTLGDIVAGTRETPSGLSPYYTPLKEVIKGRQQITGDAEEMKNYVLIIDEINRANISRVFGELITLLEDDKRLGEKNELKITLPNGEREFGIPPNLYLIGTMNTADKSIALVDIALRRRFEFIGKYPEYDKLKPEHSSLLAKINSHIFEKKKSADYLIGHAYFMNDLSTEVILKNKVIPLLMEYFSSKIEHVSSIFTASGWKVSYNYNNHSWLISKE